MYTAEEQAEHRKQWVDALRSGEYEQVTGHMRAGDKFCCLGVACDISGLGEWKLLNAYDVSTKAQAYHIDGIYNGVGLPAPVIDWLGVTHYKVRYAGKELTLTMANDVGFSFNEIADIIENGKILLKNVSPWS